jgi:hypothetical protein
MPRKMMQLSQSLGLDSVPLLDDVVSLDRTGTRVQRGEILFPRDRE